MIFELLVFGLLALTSPSLASKRSLCKPSIESEPWGDVYSTVNRRREPVIRYTLKNCLNTSVQIISYGASISSIITPDIFNRLDDIVLGFDDINGKYF